MDRTLQPLKTVYHLFKSECSVTHSIMCSNFDGAFFPVPIFTFAALLHRGASIQEAIPSLLYSLIYVLLYHSTFDIANNCISTLEDNINKPYRPLVSGNITRSGMRTRLYVSAVAFLVYSAAFGLPVLQWSLVWSGTVYSMYSLGLTRSGPTKDACVAIGIVAQLTAAWGLGSQDPGVDQGVCWEWMRRLGWWVAGTIAVQDLRDVEGDRACGRWTTPILLGDWGARLYVSVGLLVHAYLIILDRMLQYRYDISTVAMSALLAAFSIALVIRLFLYRSIRHDQVTYRWYTTLY